MGKQTEYTRRILQQLDLEYTPEKLAQSLKTWWWSPQPSSLRLTRAGFDEFIKVAEYHEITLENRHKLTSAQTIGLQRYITCPFYCHQAWFKHRETNVISKLQFFEQRPAVEFILMGADIQKFIMFRQAKKHLTK